MALDRQQGNLRRKSNAKQMNGSERRDRMFNVKWSASEKKVARDAYDRAWEAAIAKVMAEFKRRANAAASASDLWAIEDYLRDARKEIGRMFDYRYSRLLLVFGWAIREGYMNKASLEGLSGDKLEIVRSIASRL
jgi:Photoprotection regulator fluorescence recovery protein